MDSYGANADVGHPAPMQKSNSVSNCTQRTYRISSPANRFTPTIRWFQIIS